MGTVLIDIHGTAVAGDMGIPSVQDILNSRDSISPIPSGSPVGNLA